MVTSEQGVPQPSRWTVGRIALVVVGSVLALIGAGMLFGGAGLLWIDQTQGATPSPRPARSSTRRASPTSTCIRRPRSTSRAGSAPRC